MASAVCRLIQDLNLNDHSNVVEKEDDFKAGFEGGAVTGEDIAEEEEEYSDDEFILVEPTVKRIEIDENTSEEILKEIIMMERNGINNRGNLALQAKNDFDDGPLFPFYNSSNRIPLYTNSEKDYFEPLNVSELLEMLVSLEESGEEDENIDRE